MTNEHSSLEKYTSHTLYERVAKGLCVRGELETEQTATYWPQVPLSLAALLSHSAGLLNRGSWGPHPLLGAGSHCFELTPTNSTLRDTRLYDCLTPTCFLWRRNCTEFNQSTVKVIPWYLRPVAPVIYKGASLIWQLGRGPICNTRPEIERRSPWPLVNTHLIRSMAWFMLSTKPEKHLQISFSKDIRLYKVTEEDLYLVW